MDDDKINPVQNQTESEAPVPIAEEPPSQGLPPAQSIPVQTQNVQPAPQPTSVEELVPEEVPADLTPAQITPEQEFIPPADTTTTNNKSKYFIIAGGALFFIVIFVVVLSLLLGGKKSTKPVAATLTYWGLWEDEQTMQPLIDEYTKKHPEVKIKYTKMDPISYRDKLLARSKENLGPDIFRYHNTWLPEVSPIVSALPDSVMTNAEFEKTFYKVHQTDLKIGTKYYGIPLMIDGLVLAYNDGLFKKAGISSAPTTWNDVFDYLSKLTVKNSDKRIITSGIALGTSNNVEHFSDIVALFLVQNGVDMKTLDSKEGASALEAYRKFAEGDDAIWDDTMPNSLNAFIQEKVAMVFIPSWEVLTIKAANPQLRIKVAPVPQLPEKKLVSVSNYWVEGVSKFSKNQMQAWEFLKYLSDADTETKMYQLQSSVRQFGTAYSRKDLASKLADQEYLAPVIKQATDGEYVTMPMITRTYDSGLNDEIVKYIQQAIDDTAKGVTYSQAMATVGQGVKQVTSKYNSNVQ